MADTCIRKVVIYPYSLEFTPIARYFAEKHNFDSMILVAPEGFMLEGKDAAEVDKSEPLGITVRSEVNVALTESDTLIIADGNFPNELRNNLVNLMDKAIEQKKHIICTIKLTDEEHRLLITKSNSKKIIFRYCYYEFEKSEQFKKSFLKTNVIYRPECPVVFVGGLYQGLNQLDVILKLKEKLTADGYRVVALVDRPYGEIAGCYSIPSFIKAAKYDEKEKIYMFNQYIETLDNIECPDLFLIELPGGLIKYDNKIANDFGAYAFLVSQAVNADYFICCIPYSNCDEAFLSELSTKFKYLFGASIDCFHMSNTFLNIERTREMDSYVWVCVDQDMVNQVVGLTAEQPISIRNFFNKSHCQLSYNNMINQLHAYSPTS